MFSWNFQHANHQVLQKNKWTAVPKDQLIDISDILMLSVTKNLAYSHNLTTCKVSCTTEMSTRTTAITE